MSSSRKRRPRSQARTRGHLELPESPELERAVLGGLQHADDIGATLARLEPADFASECHRTIFRAIQVLASQGRRADIPQLIDTLEQAGDLVDVGGRAYIASLDLNLIPSNLDGYIDRLKELRALRQAAVSAEKFLGELGDSVPARIPEALAALEARLGNASAFATSAERNQFRPLAEVTPESVEFLWKPYLPVGKLTLLEGDPGQGKSFLAAAIAASGSRGHDLPGAGAFEPWNTLILTAEDGLADTLRPRLDRLGADVDRIFGVEDLLDLSAPQGLGVLERAIREREPRLVVIDPVVAYVGARTDLHRANQVRAVLGPLARLAAKTRTAVVAIRHLNKSQGTHSLYRGHGSIDFTAAARSVLLVGSDPEDAENRVVIHLKSNLARLGRSLAYTIRQGVFAWSGWSQLTAWDLLQDDRTAEERTAIGEAKDFLVELLADGPQASKDVLQGAKAAGVSEKTLRRAKSQLKVKVRKTGFQGKWCWALPGAESSKVAMEPKDGQEGHKGRDGHLWEKRARSDESRPA
ncbi:MAG: AAA family ATPase [bacterium]|nr:AAA family ATPase [bacterium]